MSLRPQGGLRSLTPVLLMLLVIALITLRSDEVSQYTAYPLDPYCFVCGGRGAADAALNVLLFVPFGFAAAVCWGAARGVVIGFAISALIEIAQASIPGRFPTVGDVLWNALGTGLGAAIEAARLSLPALSDRARVGAAAAVLAVPLLPAALMERAQTDRLYFAQWAPTISTDEAYAGPVRAADLDGIELARGPVARTADVRDALRRGAPLRISFRVAPPPEELSHVFRFVDSGSDEIAALAVRGHDLVWSERVAASALSFETPAFAWTDALRGRAPGSEVSIVVRKENGSVCMQLDSAERCGLGPTAGDAWQLLLSDPGPPALRALARMLWLGVPALVAGLIAGGRWTPTGVAAALGVVATAATALLPSVGSAVLDPVIVGAAVLAGSAGARVTQARLTKGSLAPR